MPEQPDDLVVEVTCPPEETELAADRLWLAGATAVGIDDGSGTAGVRLTASYPTSEAARVVAGEIPGATLVAVDPSWRDEWRKFAEPVTVGDLIVAPAWRDVAVGGTALILRIDPGDTFGSGSHPSTRLILGELDRRPPAGLRVLDYGCGSGILSVAAARLGAAAVYGVDIEPEALVVTADNAAANGVAGRVEVGPPGSAQEQPAFDLALVNVTAGVHAEVGPAVIAALRPGATILLAGLLPGQWRHVAGAYGGAEVDEVLELDGWEGVRLARR